MLYIFINSWVDMFIIVYIMEEKLYFWNYDWYDQCQRIFKNTKRSILSKNEWYFQYTYETELYYFYINNGYPSRPWCLSSQFTGITTSLLGWFFFFSKGLSLTCTETDIPSNKLELILSKIFTCILVDLAVSVYSWCEMFAIYFHSLIPMRGFSLWFLVWSYKFHPSSILNGFPGWLFRSI